MQVRASQRLMRNFSIAEVCLCLLQIKPAQCANQCGRLSFVANCSKKLVGLRDR